MVSYHPSNSNDSRSRSPGGRERGFGGGGDNSDSINHPSHDMHTSGGAGHYADDREAHPYHSNHDGGEIRRQPPAPSQRGSAGPYPPAPAPPPGQPSQQLQNPTQPPPVRSPPPASSPQMLRVQFGSNLHEVYSSADALSLSRREVIVAPALFGHQNNRTQFSDLREDFERIVREGRNDPAWSLHGWGGPPANAATILAEAAYPGPGGGGGGSQVGSSCHRSSEAVRHVVSRVCRYFSVDEATAYIRVSYLKGQPPCRYEADTLRGEQNMAIVASFGAARLLSFLHSPRPGGGAAAARSGNVVGVNLSLANNTVVAVGRGVLRSRGGSGGWEYAIRNLKPCGGSNDGGHKDDSITVSICGRCTAMEPPPSAGRPAGGNGAEFPRPAKRRRSGGS